MNIIFLGSIIPPERLDYYKEASSFIDYPGNILQEALLEGFCSMCEVRIISVPKLRTNKIAINGYGFKYNGVNENLSLGYINLYGIKQFQVARKIYRTCKEIDFKFEVLFIYSIGSASLKAACKIKKKYPYVKIISMITDLPQYMSSSKNWFYKFMKKIDLVIIKNKMRCVDGFVLLSPYMRNRLSIDNRPWIQIEGIYNSSEEISPQLKDPHKVVMYAGTLGRRHGIIELLDAFSQIHNPEYRLWLVGNGDCVDEIINRTLSDTRIIYFGIIRRPIVLNMQKRATLLINPRQSREEFTKYSFPSKTMEYMASGTPTLIARIASLPKDYEQYLFFFDDESVKGMRNKIVEICEKPKDILDELGRHASQFIYFNKNAYAQVNKIVNLIDSVEEYRLANPKV